MEVQDWIFFFLFSPNPLINNRALSFYAQSQIDFSVVPEAGRSLGGF